MARRTSARTLFITLFLFILSITGSTFYRAGHAQPAAITGPTSARVLNPKITQSLQSGGVYIDPNAQRADLKSLRQAVAYAPWPVYVLILRVLPPKTTSATQLAAQVRDALQPTPESVVIVAAEVQGSLGLSATDISPEITSAIIHRTGPTWTNQGYSAGVVQIAHFIQAQREARTANRTRLIVTSALGLLFALTALYFFTRRLTKRRRPRRHVEDISETPAPTTL